MIKLLINQVFKSMHRRFDYDVAYLQEILATDTQAAMKLMGFQVMSSHTGGLPAEAIFVVRIRSTLHEDCGPCVQLMINMALQAKVNEDLIMPVITGELNRLTPELKSLVRFTDAVLSHDPKANELRSDVIAKWGKKGMIAIAYAISTSRVFPAMKFALGHGQICQQLNINDMTINPKDAPSRPNNFSVNAH